MASQWVIPKIPKYSTKQNCKINDLISSNGSNG